MKAKAKLSARDFVKLVEWSEEDQAYLGSAPPLIGWCCHGDNEAKVMRQLVQIVAEWVALHEREGWPLPQPTAGREYSGKFVLRMKPETHRALALRALCAGQSLNTYCAEHLAGTVAAENAATQRLLGRGARKPRAARPPKRRLANAAE